MSTVIIFICALSLLVFVHEWGHFIVAKLSGVRVDIFSIGFGPKILGFTWHGTEYRIAPFPFGGYVRIYGQEPMDEAEGDAEKAAEIANHPDSFASKPLHKKLAVVFAGPVMNLVLCFVLIPIVFMVGRIQPKILEERPVVIDIMQDSPAQKIGLQAGDEFISFNEVQTDTWKTLLTQIALHPENVVTLTYKRGSEIKKVQTEILLNPAMKQAAGYLGVEPFDFYGNEPLIESVRSGSPAETAGLKEGDEVISFNGDPLKYWTDMTKRIQENKGKEITLGVKREGQEQSLKVTPEFKNEMWIIGITKAIDPSLYYTKHYGFVEALQEGVAEFNRLLSLTLDILGRLFTGNLSFKSLGGPLQIAQATSSAAKSGFGEFLYLLAFLSMQLGIMNLLPIPVLDGGHIVFMTIEGLIRRPISYRIRSIAMQVGLVMLLGLMLFVTINDVDNIWGFGNIVDGFKGLF